MKKLFLKSFSVLLVLALSISCLAFQSMAEGGKPTVMILGNNENPVAVDTVTAITLTADNLSEVKGMDLVITAPTGVTFSAVSGKFYDDSGNEKFALSENENFTITNNKIRIVSAFVLKPVDSLSAEITIKGASVANYEIGVQVTFVDIDEAVFGEGTYSSQNGSLIIAKTKPVDLTPDSDTAVALAGEGCFVPYGGVYSAGNVFPKKNADGTFDLLKGVKYTYTSFKLPTNTGAITTFSASTKSANVAATAEYDKYNGIQFVSYALNRSNQHGTLVFKGNFDEFCSYNKAKYATKQAVVERFSQLIADKADNEWFEVNYGSSNKILFARIPQTKTMWYNTASDGHLQYALRVYKVNSGDKFTAVGYTKNGDIYNFSDEYQTKTF